MNFHKLKQLVHSRILWLLFISCWIIATNISLAHDQNHTETNEEQCQLCLSNFHQSPFITNANTLFVPIEKQSFIVKELVRVQVTFHPAIHTSRDPPLN